jgi:hypothetical protein
MSRAQSDEGGPAQGGGPGQCRATTGDDLELKITHARMDAAVSTADATPLAIAGGWLACYQDAWWVQSEIGWLRITDEATAADISHVAARLAQAAEDASDGPPGYRAVPRAPDEHASD